MNQDQETLRVHLRESLLDILQQLQNLDPEHLDIILSRLEQIASHILRLCGVNLINDEIQHFVSQASQSVYYTQTIKQHHENQNINPEH